jgi:hypothetical protein
MEKLGIVLLTVGTVCAVWSALMPSIFTISKFGFREGSEEDKRVLTVAGLLGSVVIVLLVYGVWLLYFKR